MTNLSEQENKIILFDGICNFCNYWINFILDHDKKDIFRFAALQSKKGGELLEKFDLPKDDFNSVILIFENKVFFKSTAAFQIAKDLGGFYKWFLGFKILPAFFTDFIYDFIAKNRYKIFGKSESCRIPTAKEKSKFLF